MGLRGSGGGRKRSKKSTDKVVSENAKRQALWRRRHPDKYEAFKERLRMQTLLDRGQRQPAGYFVWEIVNESGEILDVVIRHRFKAMPDGARHGQFLPSSPLDYWLAVALRDARLAQLAAWRGEC